MKKIFTLLLIAFSETSFASTAAIYGEKLAECSAYNSHASVIAAKIYKDNNMFTQRTNWMSTQLELAVKLIGKEQATATYSRISQIGRSYQGDAQTYINFIGPNVQACDEYISKNQDRIRQFIR
jgi:hypothetical protein